MLKIGSANQLPRLNRILAIKELGSSLEQIANVGLGFAEFELNHLLFNACVNPD